MKSLLSKSLQKGKYLLEQEIGQGGFGVTYKAINTIFDRPVVIKTLKLPPQQQHYLKNLRKQFLDEARRLLRCSHPNIVQFREYFIEDELPYIVMDYVPGLSLDRIVLPNNPLSEEAAIEYIRQVGEAVKVVHQNGLLHRDIKPQNIIISQDTQQIVLIGLGIARDFSLGKLPTHTNYFSEGYAAIEQYFPRAKRIPASDVYGLAATLYTLLTARVPISSNSRNQLPLASPGELRPELSVEVSQAVMQGMAQEPDRRPASVDRWLALLPGVTKSVAALKTNSQAPKTTAIPQPTSLSSKEGNQRRLLSIFPLALTSLVVGLGYAWSQVQTPIKAPVTQSITNKDSSPVQKPSQPTSKPNYPLHSGNISAVSTLPEPVKPQSQPSPPPATTASSSQPVKPQSQQSSPSQTSATTTIAQPVNLPTPRRANNPSSYQKSTKSATRSNSSTIKQTRQNQPKKTTPTNSKSTQTRTARERKRQLIIEVFKRSQTIKSQKHKEERSQTRRHRRRGEEEGDDD